MKRFKNILYFADGATVGCSALERAVQLAAANQARLTVLDVVPEYDSKLEMGTLWGGDLEVIERENREAELEDLIAGFQDAGIEIAKRVVRGIPFVEVIRAVLEDHHDLVVKAARPPDSFVKRVLGSTDLHLLRKCPCPIWIDQPGVAMPYRTVLAAVDPSDEEQDDSARLILDLATSLAGREGAVFTVVHAWRLSGESMLRSGRVKIPDDELGHLLDEVRKQHTDRLGEILTEYGMSADDERVHLVKGEPAPSIRAVSNELDADLIVMGTLGRTGIPGFFIGNTAEEILQTTHASVLAIKPTGFVSPLETK
jgi:nucleotide-binding universal stress UspA family protein